VEYLKPDKEELREVILNEELFRSGKGFTNVGEAERFVEETSVDWLSIAIGNIHGAISGMAKD